MPPELCDFSAATPKFSTLLDAEDGHHWHVLTQSVTVAAPNDIQSHAQAILIPVDNHWPKRVEAAARLRNFLNGNSPQRIVPRTASQRICNAMRVHGGRMEGASYRQLGVAFFGENRISQEHWKTSPLKAQLARLSKYAQKMLRSGYRSILQGKVRSRG